MDQWASATANFYYFSNSKSLTSLVGYAAIDADTTWLVPFADYLSCDASGKNDGATSIDIFGLNN